MNAALLILSRQRENKQETIQFAHAVMEVHMTKIREKRAYFIQYKSSK